MCLYTQIHSLVHLLFYYIFAEINQEAFFFTVLLLRKRYLRFMGPKKEDGVLVGRRFDSSFWKLINLKHRERELLHIYYTYILYSFFLDYVQITSHLLMYTTVPH